MPPKTLILGWMNSTYRVHAVGISSAASITVESGCCDTYLCDATDNFPVYTQFLFREECIDYGIISTDYIELVLPKPGAFDMSQHCLAKRQRHGGQCKCCNLSLKGLFNYCCRSRPNPYHRVCGHTESAGERIRQSEDRYD